MSEETKQSFQITEIFTCARCGFCCHGETTVSLDERDQERMIQVLGLNREETARRYWRITGKEVQMQVRDGHCIFYEPEQGCTVHEGRPWRCRQWPLHPSMLSDQNNYLTIAASCPGLNKQLSYKEFSLIFHALLEQKRAGEQGE